MLAANRSLRLVLLNVLSSCFRVARYCEESMGPRWLLPAKLSYIAPLSVSLPVSKRSVFSRLDAGLRCDAAG